MRTLTSPREIDALFRSGRRGSTRLLVVLVSPTSAAADPRGGVVFIAGKKLGGAVVRNRCKRVMREAVRRAGGPWPGRDVAVIARSGTQTAAPHALDDSLATALATAGVSS